MDEILINALVLSRANGSAEKMTSVSRSQEFIDDFRSDVSPGRVTGSLVDGRVARKGIDRERVMSVDNGALRIRPMVKSRWGRAALAYGPYTRQNGLAFGVSLLNGHNTSQTGALPDTLRQRLTQWVRGSETEPPIKRLARWLFRSQRRYIWRHLLQWVVSGSSYLQGTRIDENLAVGWFPRDRTVDPLGEGNAFVMHALGPECGELWARTGSGILRSVRGVQNVQMYYLVVLRERGAAYYAASVAGVPGFQPYPSLTPIAIDPFVADEVVYAGVHQSVLGQIGFRAETRVYRTQVVTLPEFNQWFGSASAADRLTGVGQLAHTPAQVGGVWTCWNGEFERTSQGCYGVNSANTASLDLGSPAGLIHVIVEVGREPVDGVSLLFRVKDKNNFWGFEVGTRECSLFVVEDGIVSRFPATTAYRLAPQAANSVQVCDDGRNIRLNLNGALVYGTQLSDVRLGDASGAGVQCSASDPATSVLRDFEAHHRAIPASPWLELGLPWQIQGSRVAAADDFKGPAGTLAGRTTPTGSQAWRRLLGKGEFLLTGQRAARVRATVQEPCPGRTAYTIPWASPRFADVSVEITPPGTHKGVGERGRGGLIFWQDEENYITLSVFVDDWYGTSIAAFFYRDGYEELYDAVWTNIGTRVHWGMPYSFRTVFDASRFTAFVNDEPVLHRALHDIYPDWNELLINQVGLVANWEWGADTGSVFRGFVARVRE